MKGILMFIGVALISSLAGDTKGTHSASALSDAAAARTSVFAVVVQCKAAPTIPCGGGLKPILLALERNPDIEQAWVNKRGSALLLIGSENSTSASRALALRSAVGKGGRRLMELDGDARDKVISDFRSGSRWYRAEEMDELSRQAASSVAARLVRRTKENVSLSAAKAVELEAALATMLQTSFVNDPKADTTADLLKIGSAHLDGASLAAFKQAVARGIYPVPGEE